MVTWMFCSMPNLQKCELRWVMVFSSAGIFLTANIRLRQSTSHNGQYTLSHLLPVWPGNSILTYFPQLTYPQIYILKPYIHTPIPSENEFSFLLWYAVLTHPLARKISLSHVFCFCTFISPLIFLSFFFQTFLILFHFSPSDDYDRYSQGTKKIVQTYNHHWISVYEK